MNNSLSQIREKFIDYFINNNHTKIPSSSLIPYNDPSLMFVNSGMVQFKNVFTGLETKDYKRAVSSQKAVRAGGKHNDLENVGYTARHHTFFEMLGNFSFGDYFKEEAIYYAWNLLTKEFGISPKKLYATVYHNDEDAVKYWQKIAGFGDDRIIRIKTSDNFWSMGTSGPCGPCSEIFYDHGKHVFGGLPGTAEENGDRYIEIWNMVFMELEQTVGGNLQPLPKKSIDTGMGLERMAAVLQGVHNNYEIDVFKELINTAENYFNVKATGEAIFSYRVITDHLRAISFLIADGVTPSNEGRGYVLRRIMRRCMNHAHQLGSREEVIYKLLPKLVELMSDAYHELKINELFISNTIREEEAKFQVTLDKGLKLLADEIPKINNNMLSGEIAFKLYDTYGFPLDLTIDILKAKKIEVDVGGFNASMIEQKVKARKAWSGSSENKDQDIWFDIKSKYGATEFLGYLSKEVEGKVVAIIKDDIEVEKIDVQNDPFILISNQTVFYGESGGQMGDTGIIKSAGGRVKVINTLKFLNSIHAHVCILEEGQIETSENISLSIDVENRKNLAMYHTATHILHASLKKLLGKHVMQKGSLVTNAYLRFDFSHSKALSSAEIEQIENDVNKVIRENTEVMTNILSKEEAISAGAVALFGEKYDDEVRVVSLKGEEDSLNHYSQELCGGTHVNRTGDIGIFRIISESAIASGVRRIEAICGYFVLDRMRKKEKLLQEILETFKTNETEVIDKIVGSRDYTRNLEKEWLKLRLQQLDIDKNEIENLVFSPKGYRFIYKQVEKFHANEMRDTVQKLISNYDNLIVLYISTAPANIETVIGVNKKLTSQFNAGKIIKTITEFLGGTGGGSPTLAQGKGYKIEKLPELLRQIDEFII